MNRSHPASHDPQALQVCLAPLPALAALANEWRDLEARAGASFFVSWSWIGPWLACLPASIHPLLLRAVHGGQTVGLAIVVDAPIHRLPLFLGRRAVVNATGRTALDGIAIEHNDFLVDARGGQRVRSAMLELLLEPGQRWRRVHIVRAAAACSAAAPADTTRVQLQVHRQPCCIVDLQRARAHAQGYIGLLSSKTRWNLRRSLQACEALGPVSISQAGDSETAQRYYGELLRLHGLRWQDRAVTSAFDTPFAQRFHGALLDEAFARGEVQLLRVQCGEKALGYLYNFMHDGRVSFYQSGFDYELLGPRGSPGMVTLAKAIEHNAQLGHAVFDFLGGTLQYKQLLATRKESLDTLVFHRVGAAYWAERWLRTQLHPLRQRAQAVGLAVRRWLDQRPRTWLRRAAIAALVPLIALALDACSEDREPSRERRAVAWRLAPT